MYNRLLISGTGSDVGKTFITVGLIQNFRKKGRRVQAYKVGPDYIDPQYHKEASLRPSKNLDSYLMSPREIRKVFCRSSRDADISVIEGVRGLYEGPYYHNQIGSTAHIAKILKTPVLMVINTRGLNKSAVAILKGFKDFDRRVNIKGVILNNIAGKNHGEKIIKSIERYMDIEVLGYIPAKKDYTIQKRHLGLITPDDSGNDFFKIAENAIREYVDIDRIEEIAAEAPDISCDTIDPYPPRAKGDVTIGIVHNPAFNFYYAEFLEMLKLSGANLKFIDVLSNETAHVDALYIGGGYPELYAEELEKNKKSKRWIKNLINDDAPVYAECGGLVYLSERIFVGDSKYRMVGGLPCDTAMTANRHLSLTRLKNIMNVITGPKYSILKGHEFHYTEITNFSRDIKYAYKVSRGYGIDGNHDGIIEKNVLASYSHVYLGSYDRCSHFIRYIKKLSSKR